MFCQNRQEGEIFGCWHDEGRLYYRIVSHPTWQVLATKSIERHAALEEMTGECVIVSHCTNPGHKDCWDMQPWRSWQVSVSVSHCTDPGHKDYWETCNLGGTNRWVCHSVPLHHCTTLPGKSWLQGAQRDMLPRRSWQVGVTLWLTAQFLARLFSPIQMQSVYRSLVCPYIGYPSHWRAPPTQHS